MYEYVCVGGGGRSSQADACCAWIGDLALLGASLGEIESIISGTALRHVFLRFAKSSFVAGQFSYQRS